MTFVVAHISNPEDIGGGGGGRKTILHESKMAQITAGQTVDFISIESELRVDYLEWTSNVRRDIELVIEFRDGTTLTPMRFPRLNSSGVTARLTPAHIVEESIGLVDILSYDTNKNTYKFRLNKELHFPEGGRIYFRNLSSTTDATMSAVVQGVY